MVYFAGLMAEIFHFYSKSKIMIVDYLSYIYT